MLTEYLRCPLFGKNSANIGYIGKVLVIPAHARIKVIKTSARLLLTF